MKIKNIIFDIGNVLVRWDPYSVIHSVMRETNPQLFYTQMRPLWIDLNKGLYTEEEVIFLWQQQLAITKDQAQQLIEQFKTSQTPLPGSIELLEKLYQAKIPLYCITDNTKGIIAYHQEHSHFLHYFIEVAVSADRGILKPDPKIYHYLLEKYALDPSTCVFIDDYPPNVEGALQAGMHSFQFTDAQRCQQKLLALGFNFTSI